MLGCASYQRAEGHEHSHISPPDEKRGGRVKGIKMNIKNERGETKEKAWT